MSVSSGLPRLRAKSNFIAIKNLYKIGVIGACLWPLAVSAAEPESGENWQRWMPQSYVRAAKDTNLAVPPSQRWWSEFDSPELDELVSIALAGNNQLNAAAARVVQAEQRLRAANGGRLPTIDAIARAELRAPEFGIGTAPTREDFKSRQIYQAGLRVAYEVDLWGRGALRKEAALQQLKANKFAREALSQTLISEVATSYFRVLALRERVGLAERNFETAQKIDQSLARRAERGDLSIIDSEQQALTTAETGAQLYQLREQLSVAEGNLAFLTGRPLNMLSITGSSLAEVRVPSVEPGLPSALMCRRPDIRRAEADLLTARADLGAARKGLLPSITLTAEGGYGTSNLSRALSPQSLFTDLVGQFVQSVFDGGQRKAAIGEQMARQKELLENYRGTILAALRDTEEALAGVQLTQSRWSLFETAAARSTKLVSMTQRVFDRGALDYTSLLESQRTQFRTADLAISARFDRLRASVDLYKALGGGVGQKDDNCVVETLAATGTPVIDQVPPQSAEKSPSPGQAKPPQGKKKPSRW